MLLSPTSPYKKNCHKTDKFKRVIEILEKKILRHILPDI